MFLRASSCATLLEGTGLVRSAIAMTVPTDLDAQQLQERIAETRLQTVHKLAWLI